MSGHKVSTAPGKKGFPCRPEPVTNAFLTNGRMGKAEKSQHFKRTNDVSFGHSDDEVISAVEEVEAFMNPALVNEKTSKTAVTGKRSRALDRVLGNTDKQKTCEMAGNAFTTPPPRRNTASHAPGLGSNGQDTPVSHKSPRFDPKIETGCLSTKRNKLYTDDLDLSTSLSSPLQVSTPALTGPAPRVGEKTKRFASMCPLIDSVRPDTHEKKQTTPPPSSQPTSQIGEKHCETTALPKGAERLQLSSWGLPAEVTDCYRDSGITAMFDWQAECLCLPGVLEGRNLVYSAPTSAGKTLVAELLMLKRVLETRRKAILILPFVSVAREKTNSLQRVFDKAGIRVDGFMGGCSPAGGFAAVDIAVCTIEKANSLINRLLDAGNISTIGTVVVDELHMVGDSHRGYLLELLLTKIRFTTSRAETTGAEDGTTVEDGVQVIGMSATLPNLDLLGRWLDAIVYQTDFRPVPLTECLKVGTILYDSSMKKMRDLVPYAGPVKGDEDHVVSLCLETMADGHSVLIFCPTKNWCEKLAMNLANNFFHIVRAFQGDGRLPVILDRVALRDVIEQLKRTPVGLDNMLAQIVPHGVAFHHAGLTFDERDIIEGAFRGGSLRVLVATSTLSSGVNLPARRVLIRTPKFHGQTLDTLTYKQMVGRAGRKGVDTLGESVLLCKGAERDQGRRLLTSRLAPVSSCLLRAGEHLSSSMKRAILEVVVSGVARTPVDVETYAACTLLAASETGDACSNDVISACIKFLSESEFIVLRKTQDGEGTPSEQYETSQLGRAVLVSALSPDEGLIVFAELQRARRNFVLENELHILYQVTPIYQVWTNIDWYHYLCIWESLPPDQRRVSDCVGVTEAFLARAVQGRVASSTAAQQRALAIHRRFYTALVLQDLIQEVPLPCVADKYRCTRGVLQSLQQSAATFSGMVTVFCSQLGWNNLELLLAQFQSRLTFGVQRELVDLVRVSLLNGHRARVLFNAGYQTTSALANASAPDIERLLRKAVPFQSMKKCDLESEWELAERRKARCIWVTGQKGVSEQEASIAIILEARQLVENDLGVAGIQWKPCEVETNDTVKDTNTASSVREIQKRDQTEEACTSSTISKTKNDTSDRAPVNLNTIHTLPVSKELQQKTSKYTCEEKEIEQPYKDTEKHSHQTIRRQNKEQPLQLDLKNGEGQIEEACTDANNMDKTSDKKCLNVPLVAASPRRSALQPDIVRGNIKTPVSLHNSKDLQGESDYKKGTPNRRCLKSGQTEYKPVTAFTNEGAGNISPNSGPIQRQSATPQNPSAVTAMEIDEFNDSFVFDTQLVNLISETSVAAKDKSENPTKDLRGKSGEISGLDQLQSTSIDIASVEALPKTKIPLVQEARADLELVGGQLAHSTFARSQNVGNRGSQVSSHDSGKGTLRSPEMSLQLDLSNDDDLENFMDQYCTQNNEGSVHTNTLARIPAAIFRQSPSPVGLTHPSAKFRNEQQLTGQKKETNAPDQSIGADVNISGTEELWSDLEGAIDVSTGDELALGNSLTESPKSIPGSRLNYMSLMNAVLQDDHSFSFRAPPPPLKPAKDSLNVSNNEEMAYMSLQSDSSALLELEDVPVPDEAGNTKKVDENLSQYFEENFGSYSAALNDTWSFSLNKALCNGSVNPDIVQSYTESIADISAGCGGSSVGEKNGNIGQVLHCADPKRHCDIRSHSIKAHDESNFIPKSENKRISSEEKERKRKSEEKTSECTPSKVRKTGDADNDSGSENKNESNASDCVPPTPPELSLNSPKTQNKRAGKKPSKTPSRRSKRLKDSECTTQLKYDEGKITQSILKKSGAVPTDGSLKVTQALKRTPTHRKHLLTEQNVSSQLNVTTVEAAKNINISTSPRSFNQSIPLTNERFTIIDVAANKDLFEHFLNEWATKNRYALCFACEKLDQSSAPVNVIGANFTNTRTSAPVSREQPRGLTVEEADVQVVGLAVSWDNRDVYYVSFTAHSETDDPDDSLAPPPLDAKLSVTERLRGTRTVLAAPRTSVTREPCTKIIFDAREQYKIYTLSCEGNMTGPFEDPKIAMWMLDPGAKEQSLHRMVHNKLPLDVFLLEGLGGGVEMGSLGLSPENPGPGRVRACTEAVLVSALMHTLTAELSAHNMQHAFQHVEMPVQIILSSMELNGFGFSEEECARQKAVMDTKLAVLEEDAYCLAGHSFSLSSPDDIAQVLYIELKLPPSGDPANPSAGCKTLGPARRGRGGRGKRLPFTTSKDILEKLRPLHPLPGVLLEWRRITAALTKVVFPLMKEKVHSPQLNMSRIHALCQTHTATGRVSMAEPNIQNIPKDFDIHVSGQTESTFSVSMRHAFVPFQGGVLVAADYSQLELRIIAHLSRDRRLISILNEGRDVFRLIAAQWKCVEVENVTTEQRQQAKQVCYGMLYGIGPKALGEQLGVQEEDATVFIESFKAKYTGMRSFLRECVTRCRTQGYVETILGRRRYLPSIKDTNSHARAHAERQAVNTTVQGSAADLVKQAMVLIEERMTSTFKSSLPSHRHRHPHRDGIRQQGTDPRTRAYLLLQLHDEVIYEVPARNMRTAAAIIRDSMESAMTLAVRMPVKLKVGATWGTLSELEL